MRNKVIIITGASSGIGKACAQVLARKGGKLVLVGQNTEKLNELCKTLEKHTAVISVAADISIEENCKRVVESTVNKFGNIDVLINNAGISMRALFEDTDLSVIKKLMDVNFWGAVYCTKYALPYLIKSKGSLVGISSIAGKKGLPGRSGYSASKFALEGFLETLRIENLKKGLHVLIVAPGFTASNIRNRALTKDGSFQKESPRNENKMMSAEEVAEHIVRAIAKRKRDLILTLEGKLTVLLNKHFPKLMDKLVYSHMAKEADSPFK